MRVPIPFVTAGGYRWFCWPWWRMWAEWLTIGWARDIRTYWHRARYGWAPRDTWSLDDYLDGVLAGSLWHLAGLKNTYPMDYPGGFEGWESDLRRWARVFAAMARDDYYEIHGNDYTSWNADEAARRKARDEALVEMLPWWGALWD